MEGAPRWARIARWRRKQVGFGVLAVAVLMMLATATTSTAGPSKRATVRVALLNAGIRNDESWGQGWSEGVLAAGKKFGVQVSESDNLIAPDQYLSAGSAYATKGYNLIIVADGGVPDAVTQLAKEFPKVQFVMCAFEYATQAERLAQPPNAGHCDIAQQESAFFAGVLAGMVTKTNKVAEVAGNAFPSVTRQLEAFELGARCVNSKITAFQKYTNNINDTGLANAATQAFISDGADIIYAALDEGVQGMYAPARAAPRPTYIISSNFNAHAQAPDVLLTSNLFNIQGVAEDLVKEDLAGKMGHHFFREYSGKNFPGVATLAPYYALSSKVSSAAKSELAHVKKLWLAGKITIPDAVTGSPTIGAPHSAAKINVKSLGCTPVR